MLLLCVRYVKNLHDAEEAMLTGFFKFYKSIDKFVYMGDDSVSAWLKRIVVNECLMMLRQKGSISYSNLEEETDVPATLSDGISVKELYQYIMELPEGYRTVFNLYAVEGYSHKEIGALLGIQEATSRSQLNKARSLLQKQLQKENQKR